jgi:mannose-6-phosphate isomerase-like protein (cupin superfamily)
MNDAENPKNLKSTYVVLDPQLNARPTTVTDTIYAELDEHYAGFKGHMLISMFCFEETWPTWEVHPHGDELVCLISGEAELVMRKNGLDEAIRLKSPGEFVVVPRNTWHTARISESANMMFVTPGEATDNREQPPA